MMVQTKDSGKVVKSGLWYIFGTFIAKASVFMATPIFTRLMSKADYGYFSNFATCLTLLTICVTWNLYSSINQAKFDFSEEFDKYISSILIFGTVLTGGFYIIFLLFQEEFVKIFTLDPIYLHMIFIYLLLEPALDIAMAKNRVFYKYKAVTLLVIMRAVGSMGCSVIFVIAVAENKMFYRAVGYLLPMFLIDGFLYFRLICKGKALSVNHINYALRISAPLTIHLLANNILTSSDRIMITNFCGREDTALYSVAYSCASAVYLLNTAMNQAWGPWLFDALHNKEYSNIKKNAKIYVGIYVLGAVGIIFLEPELLLIMGGKNYKSAVSVMPPVILSTIIQYIYTLYVNIEQYEKKLKGVAIGTVVAACVNIILNLLLLPRYGYIVAAYTTLISYVILLVMHYMIVRKMGHSQVYSTGFNFGVIVGITILAILITFLYPFTLIRYVILGVYVLLLLTIFYKRRTEIKKLLFSKGK